MGLSADARLTIMRATPLLMVALFSLFVAACVAPPAMDPPASLPETPIDFPHERYAAANAQGQAVFEIDPNESLIRVYAYRAGTLSRMGHDHVIASRTVGGFALITYNANGNAVTVQADLYMLLFAMTVDDEALRAEAGFGAAVSERARVGTRSNMLASLDAAMYPHVTLHIEGSFENTDLAAAEIPLRATIVLHGISQTIEVLAAVSMDAENLRAEGRFTLHQSDFGIQPHSALGGALAVRNALDIAFQINAARWPG